MTILLVLIPLGVLFTGIGLWAFLWTLKSRQFEDLDGAAWRVLADDDIGEVKL